jgi:HSP20 family protein
MAQVPVESGRSAPTRGGMSDPFQAMRNEMDRVFDRFGMNFSFPSLRRMFDMGLPRRPDDDGGAFGLSAPPIELSEDDKAYKLCAELPGLDSKDVDVTISGDMLVLQGEKHQEQEQKDKNYHFSERSYGSFRRSFELPATVDRGKIAADFSKGVLTITLPKTEQAQKPRQKIEVKAS